jgi:hypothetical protein
MSLKIILKFCAISVEALYVQTSQQLPYLTQTLGALLNVTCKPKNQPDKQGTGGGGGTRKKQPQRDL